VDADELIRGIRSATLGICADVLCEFTDDGLRLSGEGWGATSGGSEMTIRSDGGHGTCLVSARLLQEVAELFAGQAIHIAALGYALRCHGSATGPSTSAVVMSMRDHRHSLPQKAAESTA
jgi:hypothetical protein